MSDDPISSEKTGLLANTIAAGVRAGALKHDPAQSETIAVLDDLLKALARPFQGSLKSDRCGRPLCT